MGLNPFAEPYSSLQSRHNVPQSLHPPPRSFSWLPPPPPPPVLLPLPPPPPVLLPLPPPPPPPPVRPPPPPPALLPLPPPPPPPPVRLPPPPPILFSLFPPTPPPPPVQLYLLARPQKLVFSKLPRKHVLPLPPPPPPQPSPPQFTYRVRLQRRSKQQVKNLVWRMRADKNHMEKNGKMQTTNLTTLMIRNIPNRMTREMLILLLDQHCKEENDKQQELVLLQVEEEGEEAMKSEFDFVYLPIDFKTEKNLGYAFVNFSTAIAAAKFQASFDNFNWNVFGSSKICKISPARIQGKVQLVMRFRHSCFKCCEEEFLPVVFNRPRNGTTSLPPPTNVGRVRRRRRY